MFGRLFSYTKKDQREEEEILPKNKSRWNYFTEDEVKGLDFEFIALLDRARHLSKIPFIITSGLRDWKKNQEVGGNEDSAHLKGFAADLACNNSLSRFKIVRALLDVGLSRVGIYKKGIYEKGHIHVDHDFTKTQNVMWVD